MIDHVRENNKEGYKQVHYKDCPEAPYTQCAMNEDDYRQTEVWKRLRKQRLWMDHYRCQYCGSGINIQVHHVHYPKVWGDETMDDLVTLCDRCHNETHEIDLMKKINYEEEI